MWTCVEGRSEGGTLMVKWTNCCVRWIKFVGLSGGGTRPPINRLGHLIGFLIAGLINDVWMGRRMEEPRVDKEG